MVDIGCGNGLLTLELARAVGSEGKVIGVDPSRDMLGPAKERCRAFDCVEILTGTANSLPIETALLRKSGFELASPFPRRTYPTGSV
ncbi:methyltransferase domain-containing protein, partial [Tritonibacter sp. SIMBA_163]|uniref:methyltransferase domain-containing protein n=1 Tax=Tritonibacter sp. SIMBA_163 TaxID=3080868 RepID=UPI00397EDC14